MSKRQSGQGYTRSVRPAPSRMTYNGIEGVPHTEYDGERMRATAKEFGAMALAGRFFIACNRHLGGMLKPRLDKTPGAWRMWKSGVAMLGRAVDAVFHTVPDDQLERLNAVFTHGTITIDMPKTVEDYDGLIVVHAKDMLMCAQMAMAHECSICFREGKDAKHCPLAAALAGITEPDTYETSGCVWRDQAMRDREAGR